jgi:hypothetical protein
MLETRLVYANRFLAEKMRIYVQKHTFGGEWSGGVME